MGYRSNGAVYLSEEAQKQFPMDLLKDWTKDDEHKGVWTFEQWKWYSEYEEIERFEDAYDKLEMSEDLTENDYDIVIIGEDGDVYPDLVPTGTKFSSYGGYSIND